MLTWEGSWSNSLFRRPPWLHACSVKNKQTNKNLSLNFLHIRISSIFSLLLKCFVLTDAVVMEVEAFLLLLFRLALAILCSIIVKDRTFFCYVLDSSFQFSPVLNQNILGHSFSTIKQKFCKNLDKYLQLRIHGVCMYFRNMSWKLEWDLAGTFALSKYW